MKNENLYNLIDFQFAFSEEMIEANGEDSIYKKIKRHGTVYKGEVIHAQRKILVEQHEEMLSIIILLMRLKLKCNLRYL